MMRLSDCGMVGPSYPRIPPSTLEQNTHTTRRMERAFSPRQVDGRDLRMDRIPGRCPGLVCDRAVGATEGRVPPQDRTPRPVPSRGQRPAHTPSPGPKARQFPSQGTARSPGPKVHPHAMPRAKGPPTYRPQGQRPVNIPAWGIVPGPRPARSPRAEGPSHSVPGHRPIPRAKGPPTRHPQGQRPAHIPAWGIAPGPRPARSPRAEGPSHHPHSKKQKGRVKPRGL